MYIFGSIRLFNNITVAVVLNACLSISEVKCSPVGPSTQTDSLSE